MSALRTIIDIIVALAVIVFGMALALFVPAVPAGSLSHEAHAIHRARAESRQFRRGLIVPTQWERAAQRAGHWGNRVLRAAPLPSRWDWRERSGTTTIRDQGAAGTCWAFSMTKVIESVVLIGDRADLDMSEQWIVNCNTAGYGTDGGWFDFGWWADKPDRQGDTGAVLEADCPYTERDDDCGDYPHYQHIESWAFIPTDRNGDPDVDQIKAAIVAHGPVACAVYVGSKFQVYSGGVFSANEARTQDSANHAVALVGWDDADGAWIMANSWGPA